MSSSASKKILISESSKTRIELEVRGTSATLLFQGNIDEDTSFGNVLYVLAQNPISKLEIDLQKAAHMNSVGIREWIMFLGQIPPGVEYSFVRMNEAVVEQASTVTSILGRKSARVESFYAPYFCGKCDSPVILLIKPEQVVFDGKSPKAPEFPCPKCSQKLDFDWPEEDFFAFLKRGSQ